MQSLTFHDTQFDIVDRNGQPWLRGYQIGTTLGYSNPGKKIHELYTRHADEFSESMTALVKLPDLNPQTGDAGQLREVRIFSLRGAHLLAMFARTKVAKEFRRWVLDVLEGIAIAPANPKRKPKALPNGLTSDQQGALRALVKARIEDLPETARGRAARVCWSALKAKFGCGYKEIAPEQFTEAVSLVARIVLEGELLEPEAPKVLGRLPIDFPIEDWKARNPHQFQHDDARSNILTMTCGDVLLCEYSPAEALLGQLAEAGYRVEGPLYELRSLRSLAKRLDLTMRLMAGNLRQALDGFESDRRTLQRFEGAKAQR